MAKLIPAPATLNAMLTAWRDGIDAAGTPGSLLIYGGGNPGEGPLLGTLTFSFPCAPDASGGELAFAAISDEPSAQAEAEARWARAVDGNGLTVFECDVGGEKSDALIRMKSDRALIQRGGPIAIEALRLKF